MCKTIRQGGTCRATEAEHDPVALRLSSARRQCLLALACGGRFAVGGKPAGASMTAIMYQKRVPHERNWSSITPTGVVMKFGSARADDPRLQAQRHPSLYAALEIATGEVTGACDPRPTHEEFLAFLNALVRAFPRKPLYVVLDNSSTHARQRSGAGSSGTTACTSTSPRRARPG